MVKVYKPYSSFFVSLSLISLSCSFLHLSISSLASSTSLHTLLAIFTDIRFPFTVTHAACQSYFIVLTVHTRDVRNVHKTSMACQSYFIVLTVHTCNTCTKFSQTISQCRARSGLPAIGCIAYLVIDNTLTNQLLFNSTMDSSWFITKWTITECYHQLLILY